MRTCLSAALLTLLSVSLSMGQSNGVVFVGDLQSVDRAVLEAADLPLPSVGQLPPRGSVAKPAPSKPAPVRPAAYQGQAQSQPRGMQPTTQSEPPRKTLFGSLKAPSWLTGKKKPAETAVDPFSNAAAQARRNVAQSGQQAAQAAKLRDPSVQPIPAHAGQQASPIAAVGYQSRQPQGVPLSRPAQMQMEKQQVKQRAKQPKRNSGLALRKENGPRSGLLSGLFGGSKSQPTPAAQPSSRQPMTRKVAPTRPATMVYSSGPKAPPKSNANTLRKAAPKPAPRPTQRLASRTSPAQPKPMLREPAGVPKFVGDTKSEPAGSVVMVSDADPSATPVAAKPARTLSKSAPLPLVVGPESKPLTAEKVAQQKIKVAPKPAAPTPLVVTDTRVKPIQPAPKAAALKPAYVRTAPRAKPMPVVEAEPSERSRALLAEAHDLAATANTYDGFSAVVQRCRYVLAIDQSKLAQAYANQLAGWALTKRGDTLETEGRYDEARNDFHDALACDPECWRAVHALGVLAAREADNEGARRRFDETIDMNPEYAKAYSNRAALAVQSGDYQAALHDYQRAIEIDPDMSIAHTGRGRVCHMLGLLDQGLQHLDAAAMLNPQDAMIAIGRGDLLTDLGRYGQALQAYRRAIELEPSLAAAHRNLAWMQATCPVESFRDGESALQHAEIAERLVETADDLTLDTKAAALAAVGRFDEAKQLQREALELAPESDAGVYLERLSMYERGESFTSQPVAVRQANYTK